MMEEPVNIEFKYHEDKILENFEKYLRSTYSEHYKGERIECFDAWMALGDATPTFRNTAIKYLWRYGKKSPSSYLQEQKDLYKALHYIFMMIHNDFYRGKI